MRSSFFIYLSPALRKAAAQRSMTAGSFWGTIRFHLSIENCGMSRSISAPAARASSSRANSL